MKTKSLFLTLLALVVATGLTAKVKKIGMIGLDTSHSIAFVKSFNDKSGPHAGLGEYRVVAAYPHGSYTIPSSYERIPAYTDSVKKYGVEIVGSIDDLLKQVDYVLLETNDGNMHLEQAAQVMKAGKPMFIDKPIAGHLNEAIAIFELSKKYNVPLFSSSSLRYTAATQEIHNGKYGEVIGADSYGPDNSEPSHGDFTGRPPPTRWIILNICRLQSSDHSWMPPPLGENGQRCCGLKAPMVLIRSSKSSRETSVCPLIFDR